MSRNTKQIGGLNLTTSLSAGGLSVANSENEVQVILKKLEIK
jgi:hypothetical protein